MVEQAPIELHPRLPTLPARPPTPPRASLSAAAENKGKSGLLALFFAGEPKPRRSLPAAAPLITPESSVEPSLEPVLASASSSKTRKSVGWSDAKEPLQETPEAGRIRTPLPSSAQRKPTKSILKASNGLHEPDPSSLVSGTKLLPAHHHTSFATMLESIVQQLAGKDRDSKIDAYLMLSGALKASENIPDIKALGVKMSLILQFIMRDLARKNNSGKLDFQLAVNALTLLNSFLYKPAITETFTTEFPTAFVEHAIKTFQDSHMSKEIAKHLMFAMAQQNFGAKVMTPERVGRLLAALNDIEKYVKGKSILMGRLSIYRTLLRQSRPLMAACTSWLPHLFTEMTSKFKEVREPAVAFGLEASSVLGTDPKVSRLASNLYGSDQGEEGKFGNSYCDHLRNIVRSKQDSEYVPQIWSVMILFLRGKPNQLVQSPFLSTLLDVILDCFNTSDHQTRIQANYAWNRFIFATQPDGKADAVIKIRGSPLLRQLTFRKSPSERKAAIGTLCTLLYYMLKPASSTSELDLYWDAYVVVLIDQCLIDTNSKDKSDLAHRDLRDACLILQNLFDSAKQRPWNDGRALDTSQPPSIEATELPALDPKWLRRSATRVFSVLTKLFEKLYWELGQDSAVTTLWKTYVSSIASPSVMEIKVSNDTMASVASIFSFLYRIWNAGPRGISSRRISNHDYLRSFEEIVVVAIRGLGNLPFTDRLLCINTDSVLPVSTPSHRPGKLQGVVRSPLHHLVCLLGGDSPGLEYDGRFSRMVHCVLLPFFDAKKSSKSRIELAKDLLQYLPPQQTQAAKMIWGVLADFATFATDTRDPSDGSGDHPLGVDYRSVVSILDAGIKLFPSLPPASWNILFEALVASAMVDAGDAGKAIVIIEPLSKCLLHQDLKPVEEPTTDGLAYYHRLLAKTSYPKDRQALDAARKRLWGTEVSNPKLSNFDPYLHLYDYVEQTLESTYISFSERRVHEYIDMISITTQLLARGPEELIGGALSKIQKGVSSWIVDRSSYVPGASDLLKEISLLWHVVCDIISRCSSSANLSTLLADLETTVCGGLESRHKILANRAIQMWNSTFGHSKDHLEYPDSVRLALLRLRPHTVLELPFLPPESLETEESAPYRQPISFAESQEDCWDTPPLKGIEQSMQMQCASHGLSSPTRRIRQFTPQVIIGARAVAGTKRIRDNTPDMSKRKARKRDGTPDKLRHDDSQIAFQPVESSPIPEMLQESQVMTERQKEVRARQQSEAAMFPDLQSIQGPREKRKKDQNDSEPELPFYRSSSNLHDMSPTHVTTIAGPSTPSGLPPSEDEHFLRSSPTPTPKRSSQFIIDPSAPPSSPPEVIVKKASSFESTEHDIPSSPPEMADEPDVEPDTFIEYPPGQIDSGALDNTFSTYEPPPSNASADGIVSRETGADEAEDGGAFHQKSALPAFKCLDVACEPSPELVSQDLVLTESKLQEACEADTEMDAAKPCHHENISEIPENAPSVTPTPLTRLQHFKSDGISSPSFVDALTSPASSGNHTTNDEHFEDAVSSLPMKEPQAVSGSSPSDEIGDATMDEMMKDFDENVAQPTRQTPRRSRASLRRTKSPTSITKSSVSPTSIPENALVNATSGSSGQILGLPDAQATAVVLHSSVPSFIPETPFSKPPQLSNRIVAEGEIFDPNDTIVVDTSSLERFGLPGTRRRGRKRKSEVLVEDAEFLNSEDGHGFSSSLTDTIPQKRRRGRLKKSSESQSSQLLQEIQGTVQNYADQSFSSADPERTTEVTQSLREPIGEVGPDAIESLRSKDHALPDVGDSTVDSELGGVKTIEDAEECLDDNKTQPDAATGGRATTSSIVEMGDESPVNQGILQHIFETSPELSRKAEDSIPQMGSKMEGINQEITIDADIPSSLSDEPARQGPETARVADPNPAGQTDEPDESATEYTTFQSLKHTLSGLMARLSTAALSRTQVKSAAAQVEEVENMLNDTKEQLFGAGRRGRQAGL